MIILCQHLKSCRTKISEFLRYPKIGIDSVLNLFYDSFPKRRKNMSEVNPAATRNSVKLPVDATFLWRNGVWNMQARTAMTMRPVPKKAGKILDELKSVGKLEELAPGLFRLNGMVALPLLDGSESPLARLAQLKQANGEVMLDHDQIRAGERIRQDYERAHLAARVTASYGSSESCGGRQSQFSDNHIAKLTDNALDAREKIHQALTAVGPELSGILLHVCCMAGGLEQAEMRLNLPRRAGKAVLQLALTRLARHYGFKQSMRHAGPAHIGHWAVPDFKPQIASPQQHPL
jgi:Domain of unknown function (DUF6456)